METSFQLSNTDMQVIQSWVKPYVDNVLRPYIENLEKSDKEEISLASPVPLAPELDRYDFDLQQGASRRSDAVANSKAISLDVDDLPMIVHLRGEESYFSQFSLSAEQVMAMLGVKRSRLTQISGRDLRVGKARIDHYLRPIFRPCDVEAYLDTVRPASTHKKSSEVLDQAREKLEHETLRLSSILTESLRDQSDELRVYGQQLAQKQNQLCHNLASLQQSRDEAQSNDLWELKSGQQLDRKILRSQAEQQALAFSQIQEQLKKLSSESMYVKEATLELLVLAQSAQKALLELRQQQLQLTLDLKGLGEKQNEYALQNVIKPVTPVNEVPEFFSHGSSLLQW